MEKSAVSAQQIFDEVCAIRRSKLPDPAKFGNAGSFFKNPVISKVDFDHLQQEYPDIPHFPQADGRVKLAAGWLIDQCGLKGYQLGGAAVHQQQALVLINQQDATSSDVVELAHHIRQKLLNALLSGYNQKFALLTKTVKWIVNKPFVRGTIR